MRILAFIRTSKQRQEAHAGDFQKGDVVRREEIRSRLGDVDMDR